MKKSELKQLIREVLQEEIANLPLTEEASENEASDTQASDTKIVDDALALINQGEAYKKWSVTKATDEGEGAAQIIITAVDGTPLARRYKDQTLVNKHFKTLKREVLQLVAAKATVSFNFNPEFESTELEAEDHVDARRCVIDFVI